MIQSWIRYYHTLRHLRWKQIRYQLWYRIRNRFFPVRYTLVKKPPKYRKVILNPFPEQHAHYQGEKAFTFLNKSYQFEKEIDWNLPDYGKLWTYHLNYFDFLHQPEMDKETGLMLIRDFLNKIQDSRDGLEPYPISLRTINWIKFMARFEEFPDDITRSVYSHFVLLTRNIEYHLMGNHVLENGFSMLFGAVLFGDGKLKDHAQAILKEELDEQILNDGAHFERSPMYHIILLQRALDAYNLLINNEHELSEVQDLLQNIIQSMVNWLHTIQFNNGDIPNVNDSVNGQALKAETVLAYGKVLGFESNDVKLSDSGYRKFKTGKFELIADIGEVGPSYQPGHAHSDTLSFILYHDNCPVIVDRGISTYEKNALRQQERSTSSHNTVVINEQEQTDIWGGFRVGKRAFPVIIEDNNKVLSATHTGYDSMGVRHQRKWELHNNAVQITDELKGSSPTSVKAYFHFHPETKITLLEPGRYSIGSLTLILSGFDNVDVEDYMFCKGFNKRITALRLLVTFQEKLKTRFYS